MSSISINEESKYTIGSKSIIAPQAYYVRLLLLPGPRPSYLQSIDIYPWVTRKLKNTNTNAVVRFSAPEILFSNWNDKLTLELMQYCAKLQYTSCYLDIDTRVINKVHFDSNELDNFVIIDSASKYPPIYYHIKSAVKVIENISINTIIPLLQQEVLGVSNKVELLLTGNLNVDSTVDLGVLQNEIENALNNIGIATNVNLMGGKKPLPTYRKRYCLTKL